MILDVGETVLTTTIAIIIDYYSNYISSLPKIIEMMMVNNH